MMAWGSGRGWGLGPNPYRTYQWAPWLPHWRWAYPATWGSWFVPYGRAYPYPYY